MADFFDAQNYDHIAFIAKQPMLCVATAAKDGRINLSPKGYDAFRVLGPDRVGYLDLGGSGNETHAHLLADGRVTIMFNNFANPALILRLYGTGQPVLPQDEGWEEISAHFDILPGTRQIFDIRLDSIQTSCGWGVPQMELKAERQTLVKYHRQADPEAWVDKSAGRTKSIDGLPTRATDRYFGG